MDTPAPPWQICGSCDHGRIALFTSVVQCAECLGTGVDLSDERLQAPLASQQVMVRTYKLLHRQGVYTLGQLLCFVMQGRISHLGPNHEGAISDAISLLQRVGLPSGPGRATPCK